MLENKQTIVIDNGSGTIKAGFSGEKMPHSVFRSIVGYKKYLTIDIKIHEKEKEFGDDAFYLSNVLIIIYPIERGIVKNWNEYENLLNYTYNAVLNVDPSEHSVLITETSMNPKTNREKLTQLMFETFNVPSFFTCNQPVLSLYSSGRTTGIVLDSGFNVTQIVPIFEGYSISQGINRINLGGRDLTLWLQKKLKENGFNDNSEREKDTINEFKEENCYVALDYENETQKKSKNYDDMKILYDELFHCPEMLFRPSLYGYDFDGIDKALVDSIMKCDSNIHNELYSNIILSGGNSMLNGLDKRIYKEISKLVNENVKIIAPPERKYGAWSGGSILAASDSFKKMVITSDEYKESGCSIVNQKCVL